MAPITASQQSASIAGRMAPALPASLGRRLHPPAEAQRRRDRRQALPSDHRDLPLGQRAFCILGEALDQQMRHDQAEDPVAQELQPLVGARSAAAGAKDAAMGQGLFEPARVAETVAEQCLQFAPVGWRPSLRRAALRHAGASG